MFIHETNCFIILLTLLFIFIFILFCSFFLLIFTNTCTLTPLAPLLYSIKPFYILVILNRYRSIYKDILKRCCYLLNLGFISCMFSVEVDKIRFAILDFPPYLHKDEKGTVYEPEKSLVAKYFSKPQSKKSSNQSINRSLVGQSRLNQSDMCLLCKVIGNTNSLY